MLILRLFFGVMETLDKALLHRVDTLFGNARKVAVTVHTHPDGDALGSGAAMVRYLHSRGCDATLAVPDPWPENIAFLTDGLEVLSGSGERERAEELIRNCDLLVCLDHNSPTRAGCLESAVEDSGAFKLVIDHHPDPELQKYSLVVSEPAASSTCELLYFVLSGLPGTAAGGGLPVGVGTPLMAGMLTDTNNFYNSVSSRTLIMAAALMDSGVDMEALKERIFNTSRERRFRAMGYYIHEGVKLLPGGVAFCVFDKMTIEKLGLRDGETEGFVNLPLSISGVKMSVFLREDEGYFRVSVRSRGDCPASDFAARFFHGGGHFHAAGGRLYFPEDIALPSAAEDYVINSSARFLCDSAPAK